MTPACQGLPGSINDVADALRNDPGQQRLGLELRPVEMDIERFGSSPRLSAAREFSPEYRENKLDELLRRREVLRSVSLNNVVHSVPRLLRATVRKGPP
jgi:hypothetical protein